MRVAHVEGDDLVARAEEFGFGAAAATSPLAANAYLGAWGIVDCLNAGADVVVTGRVTDASVIVGPAAAHHGWGRTDYDRLAGAIAAGHVIECGAQATGGNYSFFTEIADLTHPGFPLAEIYPDGSSVITKHPGTGGAVTVDTVTAQLLYEITGARYANPDATLRVDTVELSDDGPDRVRDQRREGRTATADVEGVAQQHRRLPQRDDVGAHRFGHRGQGRAGAQAAREQPDGQARRDGVDAGAHRPRRRRHRGSRQRAAAMRGARSGPRQCRASILLGRSGTRVGQLSRLPATSPPGQGQVYGVFNPAFVPPPRCRTWPCTPTAAAPTYRPPTRPSTSRPFLRSRYRSRFRSAKPDACRWVLIAGARSGDKGGSANVGVWVRTGEQWRWLAHTLTVDKLRELLPETADLPVTRHLLPNLRAVNFVIEDILGQGAAYQARFDPRPRGWANGCAAGTSTYLSSCPDIPEEFLS